MSYQKIAMNSLGDRFELWAASYPSTCPYDYLTPGSGEFVTVTEYPDPIVTYCSQY